MRLRRTVTAVLAATCIVGTVAPAAASAQSLLERSPNLGGAWVAQPGVLHFHFLHRFEATDAPTRKVLNSPTFLMAAGLPGRTMAGARYATSSLVRPGFANEWEFFGRWAPLSESGGAPLDLSVHGAWNQAAESFDAELAAARSLGRLRVLGAVRGFTDAYHAGESRVALAAGMSLRLHEWVALGADAASLLQSEDGEDVAWSAGLQLQIPYAPHTFSLHVSNAHTNTLQGSSRGADRLWGFEFTVPLTLSRYFGGRAPSTASGAAAAPGAPADTVIGAEVTMDNMLRFVPDTVRIRAGQAVRWRNTSDLLHTVTANPDMAVRPEFVQLPAGAAPFDSGNIEPGAAFVHTFTTPGTYVYMCIPHQMAAMIATVIVEQ
ncbi:MAG: plastocyanin/azurin family copper-binding protein [Gemmatimonadota bacterium]